MSIPFHLLLLGDRSEGWFGTGWSGWEKGREKQHVLKTLWHIYVQNLQPTVCIALVVLVSSTYELALRCFQTIGASRCLAEVNIYLSKGRHFHVDLRESLWLNTWGNKALWESTTENNSQKGQVYRFQTLVLLVRETQGAVATREELKDKFENSC